MSRRRAFLDFITGRGMNTRDRAGRILALLLGGSIVLVTAATLADALHSPTGLGSPGLTLLLGILTLLIGTVSGFLARIQDGPGYETRSGVGTILTVTLGLSMILISGVALYDVFFHPAARVSANTVTLLTSVLGGVIGALSAYLGIPRSATPELPPGGTPAPPAPPPKP